MERNNLTRREFMGIAASVLTCSIPSYAGAKEEKTIKWPKSEDDSEGLSDVIIDVRSLKDCKDRVRIFEIATKAGNISRVNEVNKDTGRVYWEHQARYSCSNGTSVEDVEHYLIKSEMDRLQIQAMYGYGGASLK